MKEQDKSAEREYFNKHTNWDLFAEWRYRSYIDFFLRHSNLNQNVRILDLGCGSGAFGKFFLKKGFQIIGLDFSFGLLQQAVKRFPVVSGDAENIPFLDRCFDAVIGGGLIHHFPNPKNLLNEVFRVLKNNGYFFTQDPNILHPKIFISQGRMSPFRGETSKNENPINSFYLKRILKSRFQVIKIQFFSFIPPQWNISVSLQSLYLKTEKILQKTILRYFLFCDILSINRKSRHF